MLESHTWRGNIKHGAIIWLKWKILTKKKKINSYDNDRKPEN